MSGILAEIRPFKALRYTEKAGDIATLTCPPYDIISDGQRKEYLNVNPYNVIRLELPKEGEDVYKSAGDTLTKWLDDAILKCDESEGLYIYEESFLYDGERKSFRGIIARVKLEEFSKGIILPHENTLSAAKEDRFNLMKACSANFSQIYSLYMDGGKNTLQKASDKAGDILAEFTDGEDVTHRLWKVTDTDDICRDFLDRKLFIADGHHRYETALRYRDYSQKPDAEYVMMMLVPMESDGLVVLPTHRVVHSLEGFNGHKMLALCDKYFDILGLKNRDDAENLLKEIYEADGIGFGVYFENKYFVMSLKNMALLPEVLPDTAPSLRNLDVTVLHSLVLENILGIDAENLKNQVNLKYVKLADDAQKEVDNGADCAFFLNPTKVSQIAEVAAAGEKMPQKSTYFYPKLITGLVMNKIN